MTFRDLYETCVNIDENANVYIHNGNGKVSKVKEVLDSHAMKAVKWFCIRYDEDLEICFK